MLFGSIFIKMFGKDPKDLNTDEIEEIAIEELKFEEYASNLVSSRGNIFSMEKYDNLDEMIDKSLEKPLIESVK